MDQIVPFLNRILEHHQGVLAERVDGDGAVSDAATASTAVVAAAEGTGGAGEWGTCFADESDGFGALALGVVLPKIG